MYDFKMMKWLQSISKYAHRPWYIPFMAFLAATDLFIFIVPTDALVIGSTLLAKRKWLLISVAISLGSGLGAAALSEIIQSNDVQILHYLKLDKDSESWKSTADRVSKYGPFAITISAATVVPVHPAVAVASLSGISTMQVFLATLLGRLLKYVLLAYLTLHAPWILGKIPGVRTELEKLMDHKEIK